jgi:hypothetical protein
MPNKTFISYLEKSSKGKAMKEELLLHLQAL